MIKDSIKRSLCDNGNITGPGIKLSDMAGDVAFFYKLLLTHNQAG